MLPKEAPPYFLLPGVRFSVGAGIDLGAIDKRQPILYGTGHVERTTEKRQDKP